MVRGLCKWKKMVMALFFDFPPECLVVREKESTDKWALEKCAAGMCWFKAVESTLMSFKCSPVDTFAQSTLLAAQEKQKQVRRRPLCSLTHSLTRAHSAERGEKWARTIGEFIPSCLAWQAAFSAFILSSFAGQKGTNLRIKNGEERRTREREKSRSMCFVKPGKVCVSRLCENAWAPLSFLSSRSAKGDGKDISCANKDLKRRKTRGGGGHLRLHVSWLLLLIIILPAAKETGLFSPRRRRTLQRVRFLFGSCPINWLHSGPFASSLSKKNSAP